MKKLENVSAQKISWIKSNKNILEDNKGIKNLYYPETLEEFKALIVSLNSKGDNYDVIGYSSNTLFLPSYSAEHVICTKFINTWEDKEDAFVCDCGVAVSKLSKYAIEQGYKGFEGLTDLPGTLAAGIYGNCGCRGCSVNEVVESFTLLTPENRILTMTPGQLNLKYRSTSLKRKEQKGVILQITLKRQIGDACELLKIAEYNHKIRKQQQPSGENNLGTTFNGVSKRTFKGHIFNVLEKFIQLFTGSRDRRKSFPLTLKLVGEARFTPYIYYPNRYMFLDEKSHIIFSSYYNFLKTLYKDVRLEIEIKK